MYADSNLQDRIAKLESQNEELNLKIKQLETKLGDERFKSLEETFHVNPGLIYLDSRLTISEIDEMIEFINKNKTEVKKIRYMLEKCILVVLSNMIKFQMMDLSRRHINIIFGKSFFPVNDKQLHDFNNRCFRLFRYISETNEFDHVALLQELRNFKELLEHEFDKWRKSFPL
jgi:hypothetical protein